MGGRGDMRVVACDMPEPCKFPSLDSSKKRFLWYHKEVDLALHPVVGLMLQVGDAEKFPLALGFKGCVTSIQSQTNSFTPLIPTEEKRDCSIPTIIKLAIKR